MADEPQPDEQAPPDFGFLVNATGKMLQDGFGLGKMMPWLINNSLRIVLGLLGVILRGGTRIVAKTASGVQAILEQDNPEVGKLAVAIIGALFGRAVPVNIHGSILNPGNLDESAGEVGNAILRTLFGDAIDTSGGQIEPGSENAERYLGSITNFVARGFIIDLIEECVPHFKFSFVHHLEEDLINGLGLGRIMRAALASIVHITMTLPIEWKLNLAHRPKLYPEHVAVRLWELGFIDDAQLDDELGRQGWSADRIEGLKDVNLKPADFGAMTTLLDHGVLSEDDVVNGLVHEGFLQTAAHAKIAAHKLARVEPWLVKQADVWLQKYESGLIDHDLFVGGLRATGLPDEVQQLIANIGGARRETARTLLTTGELFVCWDNHILTQGDVHDYLVRKGYDETDATTLLLTHLAVGQHKDEVAQQRTAAQAARAAAVAQAKADRAAAQQAARLAAAAARLEKAHAAAAAKAQALADAETRRQFIVTAAEQRHQIVDAQQTAGLIAKDQADALRADLVAHEQALLAAATSQAKEADIAFDHAILDLRVAAQMEDYDAQLAEIDVALDADAAARQAGVEVRLSTVDEVERLALADLDDLFAQRRANAADDLAASLSAVDVAVLPTPAERSSAAAQQIQDLADARTRKLADIADHYSELHQTVDEELAAGTLSAHAGANAHQRLVNAQAQAERLAHQQHDLSVQRLQDVAGAVTMLDASRAGKDKLVIEDAAAKRARALAADKLKAEQTVRHTADSERLRLQAIGAQTAPLSAAAAAKRRAAIHTAIAKLDASKAAQEAVIQKAAADAAATITKAQTAVEAAQQRLQLVTSTAAKREQAAAAAAATLEGFDAHTAAARAALEATIIGHRVGPTPA